MLRQDMDQVKVFEEAAEFSESEDEQETKAELRADEEEEDSDCPLDSDEELLDVE